MDGIDISLVRTNGKNLIRLNKNFYYKYSDETKDFLLSVLNEKLNFNLKKQKKLSNLITNEHYKALKIFNIIDDADLVGFHGQTVYHNPQKKISVQLGDPNKLSKMLKKNVVCDFRTQDIKMGGQGAPLAPIYHQFMIESLKLCLPACILNIGGVANLTYWDGKKLIGFDTGPGNALMDDYMKKMCNKSFDEDGNFAAKGSPFENQIKKFLQNDFFKRIPPKSLDRNSFISSYTELIEKKISVYDTMSTLAEFTVESIAINLKLLPKKIENILVTGGGYRNLHLMKRLKDRLKLIFLTEEQLGFDFDFIESELIAYLSARSVYNLPITFPSTTGVSQPSSGGNLYNYL